MTTTARQETVRQFAARLGYDWKAWIALPVSRRMEHAYEDTEGPATDAQRAAWAMLDLPAGPQRLAALHSALGIR